MSRIFLDTNFLVYSYDNDSPLKQRRAQELLDRFVQGTAGTAVISTQVLQELYNSLMKRLHNSPAQAKERLLEWTEIDIVGISRAIVLAAADLHASDAISFWDALIVAAAKSAGCDELWTEDLQDGRLFGALKVRNPFAGMS